MQQSKRIRSVNLRCNLIVDDLSTVKNLCESRFYLLSVSKIYIFKYLFYTKLSYSSIYQLLKAVKYLQKNLKLFRFT